MRIVRHLRLCAPVVLLMLAACGEGASDGSLGGVSASEAQALNDAAEMLDNRAMPVAGNGVAPKPPRQGR